MRLLDALRRSLRKPTEFGAKCDTHASHIKAIGLLAARAARPPAALPPAQLAGVQVHRLATFAPNTPNRAARRSLPLAPRAKRTAEVPIYYRPAEDTGEYTGAKLRQIRADGKHR